MAIHRRCCAALVAVLSLLGASHSRATAGEVTLVTFKPAISNLEFADLQLSPAAPPGVTKTPTLHGDPWFGQIRHLTPRGKEQLTTFLAEFVDGQPSRIWFDANRDGDFTDDSIPTQYSYPGMTGSRCIIVNTGVGSPAVAAMSLERIVVEPAKGQPMPRFRVQSVYAMQGVLRLGRRTHVALLFDGNRDGLYTMNSFDGLLVDENDDLKFDVDLASPEFGPMTAPFNMGGQRVRVLSVQPSGQGALVEISPATTAAAVARVGRAAPDFECVDTDAKPFRLSAQRGHPLLIHFWASWCDFCRGQAPRLARLYERFHPSGLEVLGVSLDSNAASMRSFRSEFGETWPTTFTGLSYWEDPVARLYGADGLGGFYLVDATGILAGRYDTVDQVESKLAALERSGGWKAERGR